MPQRAPSAAACSPARVQPSTGLLLLPRRPRGPTTCHLDPGESPAPSRSPSCSWPRGLAVQCVQQRALCNGKFEVCRLSDWDEPRAGLPPLQVTPRLRFRRVLGGGRRDDELTEVRVGKAVLWWYR